MKRIIIVFLFLSLLSGCTFNMYPKEESVSENTTYNSEIIKTDTEYVKSVWIAYYELQSLIKNRTEGEFKEAVSSEFNKLKSMGFNTVTVQVRAFADSVYPSKYFTPSQLCFPGNETVPFDALKIMCSAAEKNGLRLEAWINPYRVLSKNDINALPEKSIAKKWLNNKRKKRNVYIFKKGIYFNPASRDVTKLIINGVKEIAENYKVSAIHFDDYFYPVTKKDIDSKEYKNYLKKGGKLSLSDWRRENISNMVKGVYKAVKAVSGDIRFGISPAASIDYNKNELFADVEAWVSKKGYVDYICPQVYFGFLNIYQPFMFTVKKWMYISKCDIYIGLPLYKCAAEDKYASKDNKAVINEFKNNTNIISRQITYLSKLDEINGYYVFSYSSLFDENKKKEVDNMLKAMQGSSRSQAHNQ